MFSELAFDPSSFDPAAFSMDAGSPPVVGPAFSALAFDSSAFDPAAFSIGVGVAPAPEISYTPIPRKVLLLEIGAAALPSVTPPVRQASPWFPIPYTPPALDPPTGLVATGTLGGLRISWDAVTDPQLTYQLERAPDASGSPGTWAVVYVGDRRQYSSNENAKTWWRVTSTLRGLAGAPSAAIPALPSASGVIQQALVYLFQRAASAPAVPSTTVVYTFATAGSSGVNNGWSGTAPTADGNPLWVTVATALSDNPTDNIASGEWASPVVLARDGVDGDALPGEPGADGLNIATINLYKRAASAPAVPSEDVIYTFASAGLSGVNNGWSAAVPATDGNPLYVSVATAIAATATDTILPGEWTSPVIMARDGVDGDDGDPGDDGAPGLNVATINLYKRAASSPTLPSADVVYTFASAGLSGVNNGWSASVPVADGNPLYVTVATAIATTATDTIAPGEWTSPVIMARDGVDGDDGDPGDDGEPGLSRATIYLYKRASSSPAVPSADVVYTFAGGGLSGVNNGWSTSVPVADGNPLYVTVATAIAATATDTIATGEWTSPVVMARDGVDGDDGDPGDDGEPGLSRATIYLYKRAASSPAVPSADVVYTFAGGGLTGVNNGWSTSVPVVDGNPLYVTVATAIAATATDTIAPGEWTSPVVMARDGVDGDDGDPGDDGAPGLNVATVYLYQRAASAPSVPSADVTHTFSTHASTGADNGWTTTIPAGTSPLWITTATAASTGATDTIGTGEWATPQILARNGEIFIGRGDCVVGGTTAAKAGGSNAWDSAFHSVFGFGSCFVAFKASQTDKALMVGLNQDPVADDSYSSLDFAWYARSDGLLEIYENGSHVEYYGTYDTSTVLWVTYDGTNVRYWKNGAVLRTVSASGLTLYADSSFYIPGGAVKGLLFGPGAFVPTVGTAEIDDDAVTLEWSATGGSLGYSNAS